MGRFADISFGQILTLLDLGKRGIDQMNEIKRQVSRAHRRIILGEFITLACWSLFAGLLFSAIALTVPKLWHLDFLDSSSATQTWNYAWIAGGLLGGFLFAVIGVLVRRPSHLSTAVEVDQRFNLKERLSSVLALNDRELESEVGQALLQDAQSRAETLDVRDKFKLAPTWKVLLPLIPLFLLFGLMFIPNATVLAESTVSSTPEVKKESRIAVEEAQEKLKKKLEEMEAKGLKDSKLDIAALAKKIDNLSNDPTDEKRDALVKLNDIKKQLDERREELGNSQAIKDQLQKMKDVSQGPAKTLADAMSEGKFDEAKKAIKDLVEKLKKGELNKIEQQKLAKDLKAMADQIEKLAQANEEKKQELQEKIDEAAKNGDLQKAAQLQQKLDQLKKQDQQIQQMQKMGQKLKECAECMQPGQGKQGQQPGQGKQGQQSGQGEKGQNPTEGAKQGSRAQQMKEAAQSLEDLAQQLEQMQQEMQQLQDLDEMMEEVEAAKNQCQGEGGQEGKPKWQDWAKGSGAGGGKRDREEGDTGGYKSRVKGKLQKGETVVTGNADGDNIKGRTATQARELVEASLNKKSDPLENQKLPRSQREHVQQYFNKLRTGK